MPIFNPNRTLNCRGRLVVLDRPFVMGILNATPDSFYDGGRYTDTGAAIAHASDMLSAGADIIDVGGMSTRPGAESVQPKQELERVIPLIGGILEKHPEALISIDTVHSEVAAAAVDAGALLINDISAGRMDDAMLAAAAELEVPYIVMHMQGTPQNMQEDPAYEDVAVEVLDFLIERSNACRAAGIRDIIVDPGLGFGKTTAHNYELLRRLEVLQILEVPVLIGASRKSMIYRVTGGSADTALNGTTAVNMYALSKGAAMLRVHDVREAVECVKIYQAVTKL